MTWPQPDEGPIWCFYCHDEAVTIARGRPACVDCWDRICENDYNDALAEAAYENVGETSDEERAYVARENVIAAAAIDEVQP